MNETEQMALSLGLLKGATRTDDGVWINGGGAHCRWAAEHGSSEGTTLRERAAVEMSTAYLESQIYRDYLQLTLNGLRPGDLVLELGAGDGRITRYILQMGLRVLACECNESSMKRLCTGLSPAERERVVLLQGDIQSIAYPAETLDAVVAIEVLYYLGDAYDETLSRLLKGLRPGGLLIHSEPTLEGVLFYALLERDWELAEAIATHGRRPLGERVFAPGEREASLAKAGGRLVGSGYTPLINPLLVNRLTTSDLASEQAIKALRLVRSVWRQCSCPRCVIHTIARAEGREALR